MSFKEFDHFIKRANTRRYYILLSPLAWDIGKKSSGWTLTMPAQTTFNLSVPKAFEWLISSHDRQLLPAACVHDELLRLGFDKPFAAAEFRRACTARGVKPLKAWALFFATLFWTSFRKGA